VLRLARSRMMKSDGIVWLASYPKSGNTWARALVEAYVKGSVDINKMSTCIGDNVPYFYNTVSPGLELTPEIIRLLRPAALLHLKALEACKPLIVKTHHANVVVDEMGMIPVGLTKGAVYIIRDPRDVVLSYAKHFNYSVDEAIAALADPHRVIVDEPFEHILGSYSLHVKSWTCEQEYPILLVRYEKMLSDPYETFGGMLSFMGFDIYEERLRRAIDLCDISQLRAQEAEKGFKERRNGETFFNSGRAGGWESGLTNAQSQQIITNHEDVFNEFYPSATRGDNDGRRRDDESGEQDASADNPPRWTLAHREQKRTEESARTRA